MRNTSKEIQLSKEKPLQKLTKIQSILAKEKILPSDVDSLNAADQSLLTQEINRLIPLLKGESLHSHFEKIFEIVPDKTDLRHTQWEYNHTEIGRALSLLIRQRGRVPTKNELAHETGLSRQTIHKHLTEFNASPLFKIQNDKMRLAGQNLLSKLFTMGIDGNVKAARLFFELTGELGSRTTQNYYIQINNLKVNDELIQTLSKEKITEIEKIILSS